MAYQWDDPSAPYYVRTRQPKMEIAARGGPRTDLPQRRHYDTLPPVLEAIDFGIVVMTHRGYSNGRLSVCLSSIPENYTVVVCSDAISEDDVAGDHHVTGWHKAHFFHSTPWAGRAANARSCMNCTNWEWTLYLCDDVWLFPDTVSEMLRWSYVLREHGVPLATLGAPRFETREEHKALGFESWGQVLAEPWRLERLAPLNEYRRCPALFRGPFGACMLINRRAYNELGGFATDFWAHDDVWNHKVWMSESWVNACYPGRGYVHLGAQSWHEGETQEWVGTFAEGIGYKGSDEEAVAESIRLQSEIKTRWAGRLEGIFKSLGGQGEI